MNFNDIKEEKSSCLRRAILLMLLAPIVLGVAGCSTARYERSAPLSATTPFDHDALGRAAYVNAYQRGYAAISCGQKYYPSYSYSSIECVGWHAGAGEAQFERSSLKIQAPVK